MTKEMKTTYKQNNAVIAKLQKLEEDFLENKDFEEDYEVFVQDVNDLLEGTDDPELIETVGQHVAKMETYVETFHEKIRNDSSLTSLCNGEYHIKNEFAMRTISENYEALFELMKEECKSFYKDLKSHNYEQFALQMDYIDDFLDKSNDEH